MKPVRASPKMQGLSVLLLAGLMALGLPGIDSQTGYAGLSARFLPGLVTIALAVCGLALLAQGTRARAPEPDDAEGSASSTPATRRGFLWVLAALLLHAALIGLIGFPLASALLLTVVARGFGSTRWLRDLLTGLALSMPVWLLFTRVLDIHLPFFPWLH